ncbi:MAG: hypothetical protein ACLRWC_09150 [Acutalibacter sp.]
MRKGKLGVVVCLYPILGFVCVILNQPLLCALIFGFVLVAERDEWAGRQTLQALGLSAIAVVLRELLVYSVNLFPVYIDFFHFLSTAFGTLSALVYLAAIITSMVAITRVMKDQEASLPGLDRLAYRAYGKQKPRPMPGQYPPPYGVQPPYAHPYQQPGQPYPPQPGPYQQPPQAPQQPQPPVPPQNGPQQPGGPQL